MAHWTKTHRPKNHKKSTINKPTGQCGRMLGGRIVDLGIGQKMGKKTTKPKAYTLGLLPHSDEALLVLVLVLSACALFSTIAIAKINPIAQHWRWQLPPTFPTPVVPADNPLTIAKVELGRYLFYDKRLSIDGRSSCGSCHIQALAFSDGRANAIGTTGESHSKNTPSLANVVYVPTLNWANPAVVSLETQLLTPLFGEHPIELGLTDQHFAKIQMDFANDDKYPALFAKAFGRHYQKPQDFTIQDIAQAIASFERTIVSTDSKYDQYLAGKAILNESEKRGMQLFFSEKAECFHCHGSINFNEQLKYFDGKKVQISGVHFHNTGLYNLGDGDYPQDGQGVFEFSQKPMDKGKFKAPSLRNVALTAPYNHDGSVATLEQVLQNYVQGGRIIADGKYAGDGRKNPHKSDLITQINLSPQEQADIIAFLNTLSDEMLINNPNYADPFQ